MGAIQVQLLVETVNKEATNHGLEFAWRVHAALDSWTGKVDTKASITLAIETALLGFIITLSIDGGPLSTLGGTDLTIYRIGLSFVGLSVLMALGVVVPQLSRRKAKKEWEKNMIYFGHLRRWDVDRLARALAEERPRHHQMARQLIEMSRIAWRKHVWLQGSLVTLLIGSAVIASVGL